MLFAAGHSLTAGIVTLVVFLAYTQIENHVLNPIVMSKTVRINPLLVLIAVLVGASLGAWVAGLFGGFVAALIAIPTARRDPDHRPRHLAAHRHTRPARLSRISQTIWRTCPPPRRRQEQVTAGRRRQEQVTAGRRRQEQVTAGRRRQEQVTAGRRRQEPAN